jgi:hypothetical protein
MRAKIIKVLPLLIIISATVFAQKEVAGCYISNIADLGMFKTRICLNADATFYYRFEGDMALQDGKGLYHFKKDTIFLVFDKNIQDPDHGLSSHTIMKKDFKLLYNGGKLYNFNAETGKLVEEAGYYLKKFPCEEWKDYQSEISKLSNY